MPNLPKLKIKLPSPSTGEDICDFEEARNRFDWGHEPFLIVVENQPVASYEELMEIAKRNRFGDREFLIVELHPLLAGG